MNVEALDDFDIQYYTCVDPVFHSWNGRDVIWIQNPEPKLQGIVRRILQTETQKLKNDIWTGARKLVHFYLGKKTAPKETRVHCGNVITSRISLNELLSLNYLNQELLQIPFILPPDIANLPPFLELPEGISLEIFNCPSPSNFDIPTWDPQFFQYYQRSFLTEYNETAGPLMELLQDAQIQARDSASALQESQTLIGAENQARLAAINAAQAKANIAAAEHSKALEAVFKARNVGTPPPIPTRGFAKEPYQITYERWLAYKTNAETEAVKQVKIANAAVEEARKAAGTVIEQTQALTNAVKQAQLAVESAKQAQAAATTILQASSLVSLLTPESPQPTYCPKMDLGAVCGKEYVSKLYLQFGLPDPFAEMHVDSSPSIALQENYFFSDWPIFEGTWGAGYNNTQFIPQDFSDPSYPKFTQKIERKPPGIDRLSDEEAFALLSIEFFFRERNREPPIGPFANYASTLSSIKPTAPFRDVPLLGFHDQSTIHFHCGIRNDFASIVEGGLCLNKSLDKRFAIQPHLVHSNSITKGLLLVLTENLKTTLQEVKIEATAINTTTSVKLPELILGHSQIQQSIAYEVENLTQIAQNIVATGNSNLKQVHVTFSNGGYVFKEALKQLPPEHRDTIIVITAGTTAIIENDLAHKVYNVIGDKDWPSQVCNGGMGGIEAAKQKGTKIEIIPQTEIQTGIGGHYFVQPDYQIEISKFINNELITEYEIY